MTKKILYIHGFNSAGGGQKRLDSLVLTQRVNAVMGTSLGDYQHLEEKFPKCQDFNTSASQDTVLQA